MDEQDRHARGLRQRQFGLNSTLDCFLMKALARNLPLSFVNYATGAHGFDLDDDSGSSREIVRQVLAFLRFHLVATSQT